MTFCAQFIHFRPHFAFAEKQSCNLKKKKQISFSKEKSTFSSELNRNVLNCSVIRITKHQSNKTSCFKFRYISIFLSLFTYGKMLYYRPVMLINTHSVCVMITILYTEYIFIYCSIHIVHSLVGQRILKYMSVATSTFKLMECETPSN